MIKHGTGRSTISDRFSLQEAAAKVAQEINGVAVRCNVMQDVVADGEHDEKSHLDLGGAWAPGNDG